MEPVYWPLPGLRLRTPDLLLRPTTEADLPAVSATLSADIATNPQLPRFPGLGERTSRAVSAHASNPRLPSRAPGAVGEVGDQVAFQPTGVVEVELLNAFAGREAGGSDPVLAAVGIAGGDLALQAGRQVFLMGPRFRPGPLGEPARRLPQSGRLQRSSQIGDLGGHILEISAPPREHQAGHRVSEASDLGLPLAGLASVMRGGCGPPCLSGWAHGMNTDPSKVLIRTADDSDAPQLQDVRRAAFAPVFASFRAILGEEISQVTQARDDQAQAEYLASLLLPSSGWELYVAEQGGLVVGFVSIQLNRETSMGEIGLNAVHPDFAGTGIGTAMYHAVLERMREAGMRVATVSTGGDSSHAPARRAYQKAGFNVGIPSIWLCQRL